jgi:hypothetical protein
MVELACFGGLRPWTNPMQQGHIACEYAFGCGDGICHDLPLRNVEPFRGCRPPLTTFLAVLTDRPSAEPEARVRKSLAQKWGAVQAPTSHLLMHFGSAAQLFAQPRRCTAMCRMHSRKKGASSNRSFRVKNPAFLSLSEEKVIGSV